MLMIWIMKILTRNIFFNSFRFPRSNLRLKDKIIEMEYENKKLKREISNLKKQTK